jgi:ankyrin repeat protein
MNEKCDINIKNCDGSTALHLAAYNGHSECIRFFLTEAKCDINAKLEGFTALHLAARNRHTESVRLLLADEKCDINAKKDDECIALHLAARYGYPEWAARLIAEKKCDINAKNGDGWAVLHTARYEHIECVEDKKNPAIGETAFDLACRYNQLDVARVLLANGYLLKWTDTVGVSINKEEKAKLQNIVQLVQEKKENLASHQVQQWIKQKILPEVAASALSPDQRFILEKTTDIANELNIFSLLSVPGKKYTSTDETIRDVLKIIKKEVHQNESKKEEVNAFYEVISTENFVETTSMAHIKNALQTAFCKMESCKITEERLQRIKTAYNNSKSKFFTLKPSKESQQALENMSREVSNDPSNSAKIALEYIKAHPDKQLTKEIINIVPGLNRIR